MLEKLAAELYPNGEDPSLALSLNRPYWFIEENGVYAVKVHVPFATKGEVGLFKRGDELVVEIGTLRRHIGLPVTMAAMTPGRARLDNGMLTVEMKEAQ